VRPGSSGGDDGRPYRVESREVGPGPTPLQGLEQRPRTDSCFERMTPVLLGQAWKQKASKETPGIVSARKHGGLD
jgi:hypothetical protein